MNLYSDVEEVARDLELSVEHVIRHAAAGNLPIIVFATEWEIVSSTGNNGIVDGAVTLTTADLTLAMNADFVHIRTVKVDDGEELTLANPVDVVRGKLFVSAGGRRQFELYIGCDRETEGPHIPTDPDSVYPIELLAANNAVDALYERNTLDPSRPHKEQIIAWLEEEYGEILKEAARKRIATMINKKKHSGRPRK